MGRDTGTRLYVPDLTVLPRRVLRTDDTSVTADRLLLVAEITSRDNSNDDRTSKKAAYARGEVPLYLLVDRYDSDGPAVTLFSKPAGFHYRESTQVPFGESITIPDPFGVDLDTSAFPQP